MMFKGAFRGRTLATAAVVVALAAGCARVAPVAFNTGVGQPTSTVSDWGLARVNVIVPDELKVSNEPNRRIPPPDQLVWYGDPPGDRKAQIAALLTDATQAGAIDALNGSQPVTIELTVRRFHALTPRARATNLQLGVHSILFDLEVKDASGAVLASEAGVTADLKAFSGEEAVKAEEIGQGQKIRIQSRVAQVIRSWFLADSA